MEGRTIITVPKPGTKQIPITFGQFQALTSCLHKTIKRMVIYPQQTRDIESMFDQFRGKVVDGGPALVKHWFNISCLLGSPHMVLAGQQHYY